MTSLEVGEVFDAFDAPGLTCVTVSGSEGAEYVLEVHSTSSVGAAAHPWSLFGLGSGSAAGPALKL